MTGVNGTAPGARADGDPWFEGLPDKWQVPVSRGLTDDQVLDALRHGPDAAQFRLFYDHSTDELPTEAADVAFVKLLLPYTGADSKDAYRQIDRIFRRSSMVWNDWGVGWVGGKGGGPYYKRVIALAAVKLWKEREQAGKPADTLTGYEAFRSLILTAPEFVKRAPLEVPWFVDGYLVPGAITELDAKIKHGKTELALNWMTAIASGQPTVIGRRVRKGRVLYLTEQGVSFTEGLKRSGGADCPDLHVLMRQDAYRTPWPTVVEMAARYCQEFSIDVLVVDTLSKFAKIKDENAAGEAMAAMEPLQVAMGGKLAILVLRHDRKSGGDVGDSARGSSAFGGEADIIIDMQKVSRDIGPDTYRMLQSVGRYGDATPDELLVEYVDQLYEVVGDGSVAPRKTIYDRLKTAIGGEGQEHRKLRSEVLNAAPGRGPSKREALDKMVADGEVHQDGKGTRNDPYYVWLVPAAKVGQASQK